MECTGEIAIRSGQPPRDLPSIRFPGQYFDEETGLHYNRFRYYDPSIGRYISADPIGQAGGMNLYAYAGNSPASRIDPRGLYWSLVARGVAAGLKTRTGQALAAGVAASFYSAVAGTYDLIYGSQSAASSSGLVCMGSEGEEGDDPPPRLEGHPDDDEDVDGFNASWNPPAHPQNPTAPDPAEAQDIADSIGRVWGENDQRKSDQRLDDAIQREIEKYRGN